MIFNSVQWAAKIHEVFAFHKKYEKGLFSDVHQLKQTAKNIAFGRSCAVIQGFILCRWLQPTDRI